MVKVFCTLAVLLASASFGSAKEVKRSKRQLQVYYMCNGGVSQYPCNSNNNCNYNNCNFNNYGNQVILPTSFYNPGVNCNSNCNNFNCNQYTGSWLNGQYVAYSIGSNAYSPCASSCCSNSNNNNVYNPYNSGNIFNNGYNPYSGSNNQGYDPYNTGSSTNQGYNPYNTGVNTPIFNPYGSSSLSNTNNLPFGSTSFTGTYKNGVFLCGGSEPSGGVCRNNGVCASGHSCIAGNVCCRCPAGVSAGICTQKSHCSAGYECASTGYCCPKQVTSGTSLETCINGMCPDGQVCGVGDLCYDAALLQ